MASIALSGLYGSKNTAESVATSWNTGISEAATGKPTVSVYIDGGPNTSSKDYMMRMLHAL